MIGIILAMMMGQVAQPVAVSQNKAPAAPIISDKMQKDFFKASEESVRAQVAAQEAQKAAQASQEAFMKIVQQMRDACGKDFDLQIDPKTKDPICVAKPEKK